MRTVTEHYIGGEFVASHGREVIESINPSNGQVIGQVTHVELAWLSGWTNVPPIGHWIECLANDAHWCRLFAAPSGPIFWGMHAKRAASSDCCIPAQRAGGRKRSDDVGSLRTA